jgi:hypothetical protein
MVDAATLLTREDWVKAGETAFQTLDKADFRTSDPKTIQAARDPKSFDGVWTQSDGSLLVQRWVVTDAGLQLTLTVCSSCHARAREDGKVLWAAPLGAGKFSPFRTGPFTDSPAFRFQGDPPQVALWRQFTVPWAPDERVEKFPHMRAAEFSAFNQLRQDRPEVVARPHASPYYITKIPDLHNVQYSRYMDATGTHRLRGPEDIARYAAFVVGADSMEFGSYKILKPEQRTRAERSRQSRTACLSTQSLDARTRTPSPPPDYSRNTPQCLQIHVLPIFE